ncbi:MAG TPA: pyrroloquinoline quinone-dependent dehydrogenase [Vicinamibacterales bacterium]
MRKWMIVVVLAYLAATPRAQEPSRAGANWFSYGGDPGGTRFSSLKQITKANVGTLKEVWRFETPEGGRLQTTPLIVDGTMYVVTPRQKVVALDGATGKQKWTWDSGVATTAASRGLAWWTDGKESRLFTAAASFIYAVNPADGTTITSFGDKGRIDLRANLRGAPEDNSYHATSPAVVYKDLLILGGRVSERTPASPGDERAFDVRTGQLKWTFDTIPAAGEPGAETWPAGARDTQGGANAWAGSIVDTQRGIVFIATGSPADDFYGVDRPGDNLYANCVIALDANTGKKLWHFQATRHDLWDSDFAAPPILLTVNKNGRRVDAVAATNKFGFLYIFDRVTGESLFPIKEMKVPASTVPGEVTAPTQPIPTLPAPLAKQTMTRDEVTNRTPEMRAWAQKEFDTFLGTNQPFTPLSIDKQTMVAPGWKGGVEWGGLSADPEKGIIYANVNNVFSLGSLTARGNAPARGGRGNAEEGGAAPPNPNAAPTGKPYVFTGYRYFLDPEGYQANAYPWGTLNAIDMNTGKYLWTVPFGEHTELAEKGLTNTGAGSHGGTFLTATGVLFTGGSEYDLKFRAYDSATGKVLWTGQLPGPGVSTPATYSVGGKQYVVIATSPAGRGGGGGQAAPAPSSGIKSGTYVVFALP